MHDIASAAFHAFVLIIGLDQELIGTILLSLRVSLEAAILAFVIGAPLGAVLAVVQFVGRRVVIVLVNALLGLPPVVVGLFVYLLMSRAGPFGGLGLLFTPTAMVVAQTILALPIVVALKGRRGTKPELLRELFRDPVSRSAPNTGLCSCSSPNGQPPFAIRKSR